MQIFQPFADPTQCAEALDDKRVVKMMTETAQILSTAARNHNVVTVPFKAYQPKRKLVQWAGASKANYSWLTTHFQSLVHEYQLRYPKGGMKGSHEHPYMRVFNEALQFIPDGELTLSSMSDAFFM